MSIDTVLRAVIDTNVVFEGLTKQGGLAGGIIDAWLADLFQAYASKNMPMFCLANCRKNVGNSYNLFWGHS
jgi:hypothetical protein